MNIAIVSLGCAKNQVDSEMLIGFFKNHGFNITSDYMNAECILINTCGFIESAKKEAIDTILDMADYKQTGKLKHLFVFGCLAKRYKKEIIKSMPEVDLVVGVDEYENLDSIIQGYFKSKFCGNLSFTNRVVLSNFPTCYIRISDGCDNRCSYCAIPSIRGAFKSRTIEDILEEVQYLADEGMQEFIIISQDTSRYGIDIYGKPMLHVLLNKISKIKRVKWIRVLYMYLYELNDELIDEIANNNKICKYFDIPLQHISDNILKSMNRKDTKDIIYSRIEYIRKKVKDVILRTTMIVGFPGETEDDFSEMLEGIKKFRFDRLGAFTYSREEDTKAYNMENQIDEDIKRKRLKKLLSIQKKISLENNKKYVGKVLEVLVDDVSEDNNYFVSRSYMESPDVDGRILIKITNENKEKIIIGSFIKVKIIDYSYYDLFAEVN